MLDYFKLLMNDLRKAGKEKGWKEHIPCPITQFIKLLQDKQDARVPQWHCMEGFWKFVHAWHILQWYILRFILDSHKKATLQFKRPKLCVRLCVNQHSLLTCAILYSQSRLSPSKRYWSAALRRSCAISNVTSTDPVYMNLEKMNG